MSRIGIPRGLYYFDYHPLWHAFLEGLGYEVVCSPPTNKQILELGLSSCVDGFCLPVKAYVGHAQTLVFEGVSQLFVPQIVSTHKAEYTCPNFLGLPDLLAQYLPSKTQLVSPELNGLKGARRLQRDYWRFGLEFAPKRAVRSSWERAIRAQRDFELTGQDLTEPPEKPSLRLLLLGPRYLTDDAFLNGQLVTELKRLGAQVTTSAQLKASAQKISRGTLRKPLFWSGPRSQIAALEHLISQIQGVISLAPFGCGAESLVGVLVEQLTRRRGVPRLELHLDEHTSALGTITRLEAFYDLLERKTTG